VASCCECGDEPWGSGTMELYLKMLLLTNYASVLMVF
jgi:hypothetical protein